MRKCHRNSINNEPRHLKFTKIIYLGIKVCTKVVKKCMTFRLNRSYLIYQKKLINH